MQLLDTLHECVDALQAARAYVPEGANTDLQISSALIGARNVLMRPPGYEAPRDTANARLIAAAPEMWREIMHCAELLADLAASLPPGAVREALQGRVECQRALLAKIEGKE